MTLNVRLLITPDMRQGLPLLEQYLKSNGLNYTKRLLEGGFVELLVLQNPFLSEPPNPMTPGTGSRSVDSKPSGP
ncbi:unnamed protein product [marine sediment metagenome]|uniref:Uncharacterized protein n=1 Tax=marine sediment metagenome TaxID=412755 RepID=X1VG84_9ZZZZ